ncbi:hypothetical protein [Streptomyces harbinensis]|uniref:Uncharacterized protein n=1 Tax=Streptomyces harbinensis TaxID=1176198 RepID=A0A1I6UGC3_9ACTN|nr:hypothetical protein [Streptomyces harbinensis]SFT00495.1 hypothetical protein SAMN05444716_105555 [Streptomyces harbinensis]
MATPTDIVTLAAGAALGSVGTDFWHLARDGFAKVFRRHATPDEQSALTVRLDGFEQDLLALPSGERETAARYLSTGLAGDLRKVAEYSPQAAADLRRIAEELLATPGGITQGSGVVNSGVRIADNTVKGDLNFGGHTNTVVNR